MSIKDNVKNVMKRIYDTLLNANRNLDEIKIVAVSKYVGVKEINEAIEEGLDSFGESRAQSFREKYDIIGDKVNWHFIGHLQKNKIKYIIGKTKLIHSVDSIELVEEINKRATMANIDKIDILIQVNISKEETKSGIFKEDINNFLEDVSKYSLVNVKGLMTMAPYVENPEDIRYVFKELKGIFDELKKNCKIKNCKMQYLSMGMSNDFEIAIEEGANMLRLGSVIFK